MVTIKTIPLTAIGMIEGLWMELNRYHLECSADFKESFRDNTFQKRCEHLAWIKEDQIRIEVAEDDGELVGYCFCTAKGGCGEVESICIVPGYRGQGIGERFMENGLEWMRRKGCEKIDVSVVAGNELAFGFYEKFGFKLNETRLRIFEG